MSRARVEALRAQLQPHFLFNALNTVASLIPSDPPAAEEVVESLGELLRAALGEARRREIPLARELELLEQYLAIQQARFRARLRVRRELDPSLGGALVPHLILQPIVENSIVHGFRPVAGPVTIDIRVTRDDGTLDVLVDDSGAGYDRTRARDGVGLRNTRERLDAVFSGQYSLAIEGRPGVGTRVRLRVPFREAPHG